MPTITLPAGAQTSAWVRPGTKSMISIGSLASNFAAGSVGIYGKRVGAADSTEFLMEAVYTAPVVKVLEIGPNSQLEIRFKSVGTAIAIPITYE
jgi:hypothetical protein